ncbi:hypothetical protein [Zoogloea sp.]|uniref:hypothetical protein n=1 Tax=Zoogloea sp. TaxID=49181 RepID=UPI0014160DD1|nr:MAG: hypothetical protein F9K15_24005 [Zoogloea sp.]
MSDAPAITAKPPLDTARAVKLTMADAGDPKGFYYLAIAYALNHQEEPDAILEIKRCYEDAVARGSNDAKVALGLMLATGNSLPFLMDRRLPLEYRDPEKGLALLKSAEAQSCSFTQPLVSLDRCSEREESIASEISNIYFNGAHTWIADEAAKALCKPKDFACVSKAGHWQQVVPKDRQLSEEWARRRDACCEKIAAINRARQCF